MKSNLLSIMGIISCSFITCALAAPGTQLTLEKVVVGGEAIDTDWVLTADGTGDNDLNGAGWVSGGVAPDTFQLSESTGPSGYVAGDWDCTGGSLDGQSLTLTDGDVVTCTIINTYAPPPVIFDTDLALPSMPVGDGVGTPVCIDEVSGLLVVGCDAAGDITAVTAGTGLTGGGDSGPVSLSVGTGSITATHLATNSVAAAEIATGAVASAEVLDDSLTASDLAANSVGASEIAFSAVGSAEVADNSLTANDLAPNSVGVSEIMNGAVGASQIATGAVGSAEVATNSLTASDLASDSVGVSELNMTAVFEPSQNSWSGIGTFVVDSTVGETIRQLTVSPPTPGTVLAIGSCSYYTNVSSSNDMVGMYVTISTSATAQGNTGDYTYVRNYYAAGGEWNSFTIHNVFPVTESTTFYLRGDIQTSGDTASLYGCNFSTIFIPD